MSKILDEKAHELHVVSNPDDENKCATIKQPNDEQAHSSTINYSDNVIIHHITSSSKATIGKKADLLPAT